MAKQKNVYSVTIKEIDNKGKIKRTLYGIFETQDEIQPWIKRNVKTARIMGQIVYGKVVHVWI